MRGSGCEHAGASMRVQAAGRASTRARAHEQIAKAEESRIDVSLVLPLAHKLTKLEETNELEEPDQPHHTECLDRTQVAAHAGGAITCGARPAGEHAENRERVPESEGAREGGSDGERRRARY